MHRLKNDSLWQKYALFYLEAAKKCCEEKLMTILSRLFGNYYSIGSLTYNSSEPLLGYETDLEYFFMFFTG